MTDFLGLSGTALRRFEESMLFDAGRWRDGEGFHRAALHEMSPGELGLLEPMLKGSTDWMHRDALATLRRLGAPASAPRTERLVTALATRDLDNGLTTAIEAAVEYHPAEVVAALWRGVRYRRSHTAIAFANVLLFLHRTTGSPSPEPALAFREGFHSPDAATRTDALFALHAAVGLTRP